MTATRPPLVAIGDLHGHLDLFERLLERIDREVPNARIVTLGDYVDNGPHVASHPDPRATGLFLEDTPTGESFFWWSRVRESSGRIAQ